jgi:peptidoglycan-associated lipoprotein
MCLMAVVFASCGIRSKFNKANRIYEEGGYYKAAKSYGALASKSKLRKKLTKAEIDLVYFRMGESYRTIGKYREAQSAYERMFRKSTPSIDDVYLRYGQVLLAGELYDKAEEQFLLYRQKQPAAASRAFADTLLAMAAWAKDHRANASKYTVNAVASFNHTRFNDYAPAYAAGDYELLYFTSSRKSNRSKPYDVTGQPVSNMYSSTFSRKGTWTRPLLLDEKMLNSKKEDGACTFGSDYMTLYFTRCGKVKHKKAGCAIYTSKRVDEVWEEPQKLELAPDSVTVAHPSLALDDLTLYFSSDLPGGYGGMDLWKVTRNSPLDDWGEPVNMGNVVNTEGNEMYPFAHAGGALYFASDGHKGFGGLDIFKAVLDGVEWTVENAGVPLNSSADDFGIIFERDNDRGFFSSNRKITATSRWSDDNIYAFTGEEVQNTDYFYTALVKNAHTQAAVPDAEVRLIGSNGVSLRRKTEANGVADFRVDKITDYLVLTSRKGYLNQRMHFSSNEWANHHTQYDTIRLTPTDRPIEIPNIFFEFGKALLTDDSRASLDSLVVILNDNPSLIIELQAHTDSRGSEQSNDVLSQQRAQAVVDYLSKHAIDEGRMEAVGFGESQPRVVNEAIAKQHPFLRAGVRLDDRFISSLKHEEQQEICHYLNRRTEFQVLSDNYKLGN